ncbi:MAG: 50S ribosomal protein L31 [Patescibacteria group bacterium]
MKQDIHPNWQTCTVTCSCGNSFTTGSVNTELQIDICNKCHPFFTGEVRFVDRQGRVDRFLNKVKAAEAKQSSKKTKKTAAQPTEDPRSYRELLRDQQSQLRKQTKKTPAN